MFIYHTRPDELVLVVECTIVSKVHICRKYMYMYVGTYVRIKKGKYTIEFQVLLQNNDCDSTNSSIYYLDTRPAIIGKSRNLCS